ncbi:MAG TPA: NAD/NADP octopine/nopaline dehydrogenase family protein [Verrucomicrobiae bacterium]|jgi:opine dehydrogenase|nr:NAD/NADP octopine/nopaline dehydrogenase family protein [Verrucomicrobiae bacterium]
MTIQTVSILGAGNGGLAAAADLTLRGYSVRLYSRSERTLSDIKATGGVELIEGEKKSFAKISMVSTRLEEVVAGGDVVMITAPAVAHAGLAAALAPLIEERQILFLNPGHTGGSLHVAAVLRNHGVKAKICETVTLTYICRMIAPAKVEIYRRTCNLRLAAFPGKETAALAQTISAIYPMIVPAENVLETGLSNINAIMHPAGMIGNAGRIEAGEEFYFYRDVNPAVARVIERVDRERLRIVERLGLPRLTFVELFHRAGLTSDGARACGSIYEAMHESAPNRTIKAPKSLDHRYLHEDVGYGLVPMAELGSSLGVETPVIDGLITIASAMNALDYRREGLTLDKMGLNAIAASDLKTVLREGF